MDATIGAVSFTIPGAPLIEQQRLDYTWTPATGYAIISISDMNDMLVYRNFDFTEPQFDGSKWARLKIGGADNVSAGVLNDAGDYMVEVCVVNKTSGFDPDLSADLGVLSGFLIGRCAAPQPLTVIP